MAELHVVSENISTLIYVMSAVEEDIPICVGTATFYKHAGNIDDYANYKEALNLAITEIRKSKRTFRQKLPGDIKNNSESFYAYVRSKQKVRDNVGPLENNSGNIISFGFQMAVVMTEYLSSVFVTENISSLPVPVTKFEGDKSDHFSAVICNS